MPNLAGTWNNFRVLAKNAHVIKDNTDITISSTNDNFTFTKDGDSQSTTITPTSVSRTASSYVGSNGTYELNVRTAGASDDVLVGYIKNSSGAINSVGAVKTTGTPPQIENARYSLKTRIHSGSGVVVDDAGLLITRMGGERLIVLFLKDGQPVALKPGSGSTKDLITAQGSYNNTKLQLVVRSIPTQGTTNHLSGHITWEGGLGAPVAGGLGPDDADSFVAVHAGTHPPWDELD